MLQNHESAVGYAHENISPIWSASVAMEGYTVPAIATPHYGNGDINNYVRLHPSADRSELVHQIASALVHIHARRSYTGIFVP
jgi:hypothetical protein